MKSLILTYVILGLLLNVAVWWATEVSAQGARQSWRSDIYSETTTPRGGVSGPGRWTALARGQATWLCVSFGCSWKR